jgi:acetyl-CoA C-acetyltransferase
MSKVEGLRDVFVVDGARTPFLKAKGNAGPFKAGDLAVNAGRAILNRQPFEPSELDEVIIGCVKEGLDETSIGRIIALRLGCGKKVTGFTVNRNCGSGMQAIDSAWNNIATGRAELVLAGGTEAMSHAPLFFEQAFADWLSDYMRAKSLAAKLKKILAFRLKFLKPIIGLINGLTDPVVGLSMGQTTENLAHRFKITRKEMDTFAVNSHAKLVTAQKEGHIEELIEIFDAKGNVYDFDDGVRPDSSVERLGKLKPVFDPGVGKVTAGNSAQVTDGSALILLASSGAVSKHGLKTIGRVVDTEWAGCDPAQMGLGPTHAMGPLLDRNGLKSSDIDYWEINEAFAGQVIACLRTWNADYFKEEMGIENFPGYIESDKLNIDGGAVALGHPVGATGGRLVIHMLRILERTGKKRGVVSLCIGGGQGGAMLLERA